MSTKLDVLPPLELMRADESDLAWWLERAQTIDWKWAKTAAKYASHWYIMRNRTDQISLEEYWRALSVIWTFGRIEKFWKATHKYLYDEERGLKWFTAGDSVDARYGVALINQSAADKTYGKQLYTFEPRTPQPLNARDRIALQWRWMVDAEPTTLWKAFADHVLTDVLDLGANTGLLLDAQVVPTWAAYTGVEESRAMIGDLALRNQNKDPGREDLHHSSTLEYLEGHAEPRQAVMAMHGAASWFVGDEVERILATATDVAGFSFWTDQKRPAPVPFDTQEADRRYLDLVNRKYDGFTYVRTFTTGSFTNVVVSR